MAKRRGINLTPRKAAPSSAPAAPTSKPRSNWRERLASMTKEEADEYRRADRERTKAYRARQAAIKKGEAPPIVAAPTPRAGDLVEVALDEPRPIRSFPVGARVVVRLLTRSLVYEIREHFGGNAGTVVVERSAKTRSFTAKRTLVDERGRWEGEVDEQVAFTSEGSRSIVISSNTRIDAVMQAVAE